MRPISDLLYYRGSKNTNLISDQLCKGSSVLPARCEKGHIKILPQSPETKLSTKQRQHLPEEVGGETPGNFDY